MTHPKKVKDKFIEMRAEGCILADIAKQLDIAYNTAVSWNKEYAENITSAKAFKMEEMLEKYRMTKEKRIETYGERLLAMQDELAKRDLSEVPTNKLFDMMMKCSKALEAEMYNPGFMTEEEIKEAKKYRKNDEVRDGIHRENMDKILTNLFLPDYS